MINIFKQIMDKSNYYINGFKLPGSNILDARIYQLYNTNVYTSFRGKDDTIKSDDNHQSGYILSASSLSSPVSFSGIIKYPISNRVSMIAKPIKNHDIV